MIRRASMMLVLGAAAAALAASAALAHGARTSTAVSGPTPAPTPVTYTIVVLKRVAGSVTSRGFAFRLFRGSVCDAPGTFVATGLSNNAGELQFPSLAIDIYSVQEQPRRSYANVSPICQTLEPMQTTVVFENVRVGDVSCDARADSVDAALVLQYQAGILPELRCWEAGYVNDDSRIDSRDAALILQYVVGIIALLPP